MTIATVTGPIAPDSLGRTLMHEHLLVGFAGWEADTRLDVATHRELVAMCVEKVEELKAAGYSTLVDPCPSDMGRDVELLGEVSARTGFNIICATGLYTEHMGGNAYWRYKASIMENFVDDLAELFITELEDGVGRTGIRPGVIKLATGTGRVTEYEQKVFAAGARASLATGAPIMTHTEGVLGDLQVALLGELGVAPDRILVGHCCDSADQSYHRCLLDSGTYLGFDRLGIGGPTSDEVNVESMMAIFAQGGERQLVVSHDTVWCLRGQMIPPATRAMIMKDHHPLFFDRMIAPMLSERGISDDTISQLLIGNPRAFLSGENIFPASQLPLAAEA